MRVLEFEGFMVLLHGKGTMARSRRALQGGAAIGGLVVGLLGAQLPASAEIGLAPVGPGGSYMTFQGGYQKRDGAAAAAPTNATNITPYEGPGVEMEAISTPDGVSAKARIEEPGRSAAGAASATGNEATGESEAQQSIGGDHGQASGNASATLNSAKGAGSTQLTIGDIQGQSSGSGTATRGSGVDANISVRTQEPDDLATANATATGTVAPPGQDSNATAAAFVFANRPSFGSLVIATGNPAQTGGVGASDTFMGASANAVGTATATNIGGNTATNLTQVSAFTPGAVSFSNVNNTATDAFAVVNYGMFNTIGGNQSNTSSSPFAMGNSAQVDTDSFNVLGGQRAQAVTTANTTPDTLAATAMATLSPGGSAGAESAYDLVADEGAVRISAGGQPMVFDMTNSALEAEDGAVGGFSFGHVLMQPVLGVINRFEVYGTRSRNDDSDNRRSNAFSAVSADGRSLVAAFNSQGLQVNTSEDLTQTEFGLRLKSDRHAQGAVPVIVSLEPFYMNYEQDADYGLAGVATFNSEIDADLFGVQLALESELPVIRNRLNWVGRVSGGIYSLDADGRFSNSLAGGAVSDSLSETGYRLGAETGLRLFLRNNAFLTATGAVDYLSEAPYAVFAGGPSADDSGVFSADGASPAGIRSEDLTNYRVNLKLTFTLGQPAQAVALK